MYNTIGQISLNVSMLLYWVLYIPQLWHNRNPNCLSEMSLVMQGLLYACYLTDLIYGFGLNMPWQYKSVTVVGLLLLSIQQFQLFNFWFTSKKMKRLTISSFTLFMFFLLASSVSGIFAGVSKEWSILAGFAARFLALVYALPQIIKNTLLHSGKALSRITLSINIALALLDTISAWTLNWDWPSKLGGFTALIISLILLAQTKTTKTASLSCSNRPVGAAREQPEERRHAAT